MTNGTVWECGQHYDPAEFSQGRTLYQSQLSRLGGDSERNSYGVGNEPESYC